MNIRENQIKGKKEKTEEKQKVKTKKKKNKKKTRNEINCSRPLPFHFERNVNQLCDQ